MKSKVIIWNRIFFKILKNKNNKKTINNFKFTNLN